MKKSIFSLLSFALCSLFALPSVAQDETVVTLAGNAYITEGKAYIDEQSAEKIRRMAVEAYRLCRCSGVVRADFILTPEGVPYMVEINTIPGFTSISMYPKLFAASGIPYGELIDALLKLAVEAKK